MRRVLVGVVTGAVVWGFVLSAGASTKWEHPKAAHWANMHTAAGKSMNSGLTELLSDVQACQGGDPRTQCRDSIAAVNPNPSTWSASTGSDAVAFEATITVLRADGPISTSQAQRWWNAALSEAQQACKAIVVGIAHWDSSTPVDGGITAGPEPRIATADLNAATTLLEKLAKYVIAKP